LSRVLWLQGFADRALRIVEHNIDDAQSSGHILSLCNALAQGACPVTLLAGALAAAERYTLMLIEQTERYSLEIWHSYGNCFKGELLIKAGNWEAGLSLLQTGVDELRRARFVQYHTTFLRTLAEGFARAGRVAESLEAIEEALIQSERNEEHWCTAELLRVKGELLIQQGHRDAAAAAETLFVESLDWARRQEVLSWELRTAMSLARLRRHQRRTADARDLLAAVYAQFSEGFDTADLKAAKSLLSELG
jgi:predicted ATPase